jgi:hypothetical protein
MRNGTAFQINVSQRYAGLLQEAKQVGGGAGGIVPRDEARSHHVGAGRLQKHEQAGLDAAVERVGIGDNAALGPDAPKERLQRPQVGRIRIQKNAPVRQQRRIGEAARGGGIGKPVHVAGAARSGVRTGLPRIFPDNREKQRISRENHRLLIRRVLKS